MSNKRFVPIADIDGYIQGLKKEGFYSDYEIDIIRQRHQHALGELKEIENPEPLKNGNYVPIIKDKRGAYLKLKVGKNGVKVKVIAPWSEYFEWIDNHGVNNIPELVIIRCHILNGAPRDWCDRMYKMLLKAKKMNA